ncbi:Hypp7831 [Branchiostoma lanceolatum]|uniref:Hypp7831 protein n=1 Tax=Branchiostoma lanceolatum TaxID=7740 RepID=A0A8K0EG27_BRALA|nr:Hypp7831 [Branchiostoma lanceolatum]
MGMDLKLLLLLVIAVAIIADDAHALWGGPGEVPWGPHADGNTAEARQPRDLGADVPQLNEEAGEKADSFIERLTRREKTP